MTEVSTARLVLMPRCAELQPKARVPISSETRSVCRSLALLAASALGLSLPDKMQGSREAFLITDGACAMELHNHGGTSAMTETNVRDFGTLERPPNPAQTLQT